MGNELLNKLRSLDAYPKINEDFFSRTVSGGIITLVSSFIMFMLFVSEFRHFLRVSEVDELTVDISRGEQLQINVNITFPALPCEWISLDAMDVSGDVQLEVDHDVYKRRLDTNGVPMSEGEKHAIGPQKKSTDGTDACGSCYGAGEEGECCNTCEEVRKAYRRKGWALTSPDSVEQCMKEGYSEKLLEQEGEGCHVYGVLQVNKVAGNFHLAPGRSFQQGSQHVHDLSPFTDRTFDLSHTIDHLSFGVDYPDRKNPLDGVKVVQRGYDNPLGQHGMYQYFLKIVPTTYQESDQVVLSTNQYSVTEHFKPIPEMTNTNVPGLYFFYDLSPIKVHKMKMRMPFIEFVTSSCAIVGGIFTVSGIVDAVIYHTSKAVKKKVDLGKFS